MGTNKFVIGLAVFFMGLFLVTLQGAANASIAKTADASQATVQPDLITLTTTCSTALSGGYGSVSYNCGPYSGSLEVAPYLQTVIPSEDMTVGWAVQSWSWGLLNCEWVGSVNNIAPGNYGVSVWVVRIDSPILRVWRLGWRSGGLHRSRLRTLQLMHTRLE
jgi:hypothetical protein